MIKVRCVDNSSVEDELKVGSVYDAKHGIAGCYEIDGDHWFQWRFEKVQRTVEDQENKEM